MPLASYLNTITNSQAIAELAKLGITFPQNNNKKEA